METIHGADCWKIGNELVTLAVTREGAHMAPVVFRLGEREVSPYSLSPWKPDEVDSELPVLLKVLRGDFFCLPFGPQDDGPPHGDPANGEWTEVEVADDRLVLTMDCSDSGAKLERELKLKSGETAIYYEVRISGLEGDWSYGNHPIIDFSSLGDGEGFLSVSTFRWGSVYPGVFSDPEKNEFQTLEANGEFVDLQEVPLADGGFTDVSRFPSRSGFEDLVMMVNDAATDEQPFAWSAAVLDGYVWFSLKDPADFPSTLFWLSNGGRKDGPWSGKHVGRVGIEEVCSHFCDRVDDSRVSELPAEGIPTTRRFQAEETKSLRIVQAVAGVPEKFGRVASICPDGPGKVVITSESGLTVDAAVDWEYAIFKDQS
ncbi:hypothetical protein [Haloferula sp.]|uniref:hypothetical protein n=1 Tax=Haloferula sp. TaxID=2497595 RepID=UPI00329F2A2A